MGTDVGGMFRALLTEQQKEEADLVIRTLLDDPAGFEKDRCVTNCYAPVHSIKENADA